MPFMPDPDDPEGEVFRFLISPLTTAPMAVYDLSSRVTGQAPWGQVDTGENIRNTGVWLSVAVASWAHHAYLHPGQYQFVSPGNAMGTVGHVTPWSRFGS